MTTQEKLIALLVTFIAVWQVSLTGDQTRAERCLLGFLAPSTCTQGEKARQSLYFMALGAVVWIAQSRKKEKVHKPEE